MMGILEEGQEVMEKEAPEAVLDAALIAAAQEVEHYEIGSYGTLRTWAELLGRREDAKLLQMSLQEEEEADEKLTQIASRINDEAVQESEGNEEGEESESGMAMAGTSRRTTSGSRSGNGSRSKRPRSR
jgi:ferritin-like metal-binding protein YciE